MNIEVKQGMISFYCLDDNETPVFHSWCWGRTCYFCRFYAKIESEIPDGEYNMVSGRVLLLKDEEEL